MALKSKQQFARLLGKRIRALRLEKGISTKYFEVIEHSIDRHSLSDIERGKKIPNIYTVYRIAVVLGVPFEDFFSDLK